MKPLRIFRRFPWVAAMALGGCLTSSQMVRIDAHRDIYNQWPIETRQAVLDGKVEPGMSPEMVAMSLGAPAKVVSRSTPATEVVWIYRPAFPDTSRGRYSGGRSSLNDGIDPHAGRSGVPAGSASIYGDAGPPVGTALGLNRQPTPDREVVFRNGVVAYADPAPET